MDIIQVDLSSKFETIHILPLNDLHYGDGNTDMDLFKKFIQRIKDNENCFMIYNGDNMNNALKHSKSNCYEEKIPPHKQKEFLMDALYPIRDRIIGLVPGNHENRGKLETDQCAVWDIAKYLGRLDYYREDEIYLKVTFGRKSNNKRQVYTIYATHGAGGGGSAGAALNKAEKVTASTIADLYLFGHYHKKVAEPILIRKPDLYNNKIMECESKIVISSHWAKMFKGYAARGMMRPSPSGTVPITLYAREKLIEVTI